MRVSFLPHSCQHFLLCSWCVHSNRSEVFF
jgi:hypothetical protein